MHKNVQVQEKSISFYTFTMSFQPIVLLKLFIYIHIHMFCQPMNPQLILIQCHRLHNLLRFHPIMIFFLLLILTQNKLLEHNRFTSKVQVTSFCFKINSNFILCIRQRFFFFYFFNRKKLYNMLIAQVSNVIYYYL